MRFPLLALPLALFASSAGAAEFKVDAWADSQALGSGGLVDNPPPDTDAAEGSAPGVSASASSGASLTNLWYDGSAAWGGTGNASATVDLDGIHVYAAGAAELVDGQPFFAIATRGDAIADGEFIDTFVLQASGVPAGTFVRARAEIVVDSLLTVSASDPDYGSPDEVLGSAEWIVTVRIVANGVTRYDNFFRSPECYHRLLVSPTPICPTPADRIAIQADLPVGGTIDVYLRASAQAGGQLVLDANGGYASAGGSSDLGNTVAWGGVLELETQSEEPVTDFSMLSESTGIDYRYAQGSVVPEPEGAALGIVSLAVLFALDTRQRRRFGAAAPPRSNAASSRSGATSPKTVSAA